MQSKNVSKISDVLRNVFTALNCDPAGLTNTIMFILMLSQNDHSIYS